MCGRAAQTVAVANIAARNFGASSPNCQHQPAVGEEDGCNDNNNNIHSDDNYNMSPGMDCSVISMNHKNRELIMDRKKWGLISKSGSAKKPLFSDDNDIIKLCFETLCYNARSDTLYSKPTFSRLAHKGKTCVVALDGYFEWKSHPLPKMNKNKKQPYFVYRNQEHQHHKNDNNNNDNEPSQTQSQQREPLLIAGLWTTVPTGNPNIPYLDSFTMLTTEANKQKEWLHHRMPVFIWDIELAKKWLSQPSETIKKQLVDAARRNNTGLAWHKVSSEMSTLKFRGKQAINEMKGETTQSVKSFFTKAKAVPVKTKKEKMKKSPSAFEKKNNTQKTKQSSGNVTVDKKSLGVTASNVTTTEFSSTATEGRKRPSTLSGDDWLSTHYHPNDTQPTIVPFPAPYVNNLSLSSPSSPLSSPQQHQPTTTNNDEEYARQIQAQIEQEEEDQSRRDEDLARRISASAGNTTDDRKRSLTTRTANYFSPANKRNNSSKKERATTWNNSSSNNSQISISSFFQKRK